MKRFPFSEATMATLLKQGVNETSAASLLFQRGLHNSFHLGHALFAEAYEVLEDPAIAIDDE